LLFRSQSTGRQGRILQLAGKAGLLNIAVLVVLFLSVAKAPRRDTRSPIGPCKITKDL
jgi:hypothetical protein